MAKRKDRMSDIMNEIDPGAGLSLIRPDTPQESEPMRAVIGPQIQDFIARNRANFITAGPDSPMIQPGQPGTLPNFSDSSPSLVSPTDRAAEPFGLGRNLEAGALERDRQFFADQVGSNIADIEAQAQDQMFDRARDRAGVFDEQYPSSAVTGGNLANSFGSNIGTISRVAGGLAGIGQAAPAAIGAQVRSAVDQGGAQLAAPIGQSVPSVQRAAQDVVRGASQGAAGLAVEGVNAAQGIAAGVEATLPGALSSIANRARNLISGVQATPSIIGATDLPERAANLGSAIAAAPDILGAGGDTASAPASQMGPAPFEPTPGISDIGDVSDRADAARRDRIRRETGLTDEEMDSIQRQNLEDRRAFRTAKVQGMEQIKSLAQAVRDADRAGNVELAEQYRSQIATIRQAIDAEGRRIGTIAQSFRGRLSDLSAEDQVAAREASRAQLNAQLPTIARSAREQADQQLGEQQSRLAEIGKRAFQIENGNLADFEGFSDAAFAEYAQNMASPEAIQQATRGVGLPSLPSPGAADFADRVEGMSSINFPEFTPRSPGQIDQQALTEALSILPDQATPASEASLASTAREAEAAGTPVTNTFMQQAIAGEVAQAARQAAEDLNTETVNNMIIQARTAAADNSLNDDMRTALAQELEQALAVMREANPNELSLTSTALSMGSDPWETNEDWLDALNRLEEALAMFK